MVTPGEALEIVLHQITELSVETLPHQQTLGRTLAHSITSDLDLPPFANSSMDGYALTSADIQDASSENPIKLRITETIAAGMMPTQRVTSGTCAKIMTGAAIPDGADAVIMREETREAEVAEVYVLAAAAPQQNIRPAGSDVVRGETVTAAGTVIRPAEWGLLASLNQTEVAVRRQPRVAIITTGEELIELGQELREGQIRDSNSFTLHGLALSCGAFVTPICRVGDDGATLEQTLLDKLQTCDAIVTSGGVSMGDFDPVRDVLQKIAVVHFWKIAMKPGKPVMFATMTNGTGRAIPIFGLPGNPVSVMVAFEQFVRPALLKMQGRTALQRVMVEATLDAPLRSPQGKVEFARAYVTPHWTGWRARLAGEQGSGRLSTMTRANALLVVAADVTSVEAGQKLPAQMTDWPEI